MMGNVYFEVWTCNVYFEVKKWKKVYFEEVNHIFYFEEVWVNHIDRNNSDMKCLLLNIASKYTFESLPSLKK